MNGIKLYNLLKGTDVILPRDIEINRPVNLRKAPEECDADSVLIITKKSDGTKRYKDIKTKVSPFAVICERDDVPKNLESHIMITENARKTEALIFNNINQIDYSLFQTIAITGTNGKSSTSRILRHILQSSGKKVGYIGTGCIEADGASLCDKYYSMTTPDPPVLYRSIKMMQELGCEYIIIEASSHAIALEKLAAIKFNVGIFTNLGREHLDFHEDVDSYYRAKLSLFNRCERGIFNFDDKYSQRAYHDASCIKSSIGVINKADAYATDIDLLGLDGTNYFYRDKGLIFKVELKLPGAFNVYNSLMAIKCAIILGTRPCVAKAAVSHLNAVAGRYQLISKTPTVVLDYAHTPEALDNILKSLKSSIKPKQNLIVVFGCGGERDKQKRPVMAMICAKYADAIIVTEDNSRKEDKRKIIDDIISGIPQGISYTVIDDRREAIRSAVITAEDTDIIAIIGKGIERYIIDSNGIRDFNEEDIVKDALAERGRK